MNKIKRFLRRETVFVSASILTIVSMFFVPPSIKYLGYINFSVLAILFSLMVVVAGLKEIGVFHTLSYLILSKTKSGKEIGRILSVVCFFASMLVTNDVALITFVPFTIGILGEDEENLIFILVMETIAANLGSMVTPIGNPQNLFLYSYYELSIIEFFKIILPLGIISLVAIIIIMSFCKRDNIKVKLEIKPIKIDKRLLIKYTLMFVLCILAVLHIINYLLCFSIIVILLILGDRRLFNKVDYMLLLTFICFIIFVGNISNLEAVRRFVSDILVDREILVSAIISQGISNVPASIMLAPFSDNGAALIVGTNIGGLGTIVASMASLITYKFYSVRQLANKVRFLLMFSIINFTLLVLLLAISMIFIAS